MGVRVVKAFVRENHEREKFNQAGEDLMNAGLKVGMRVITIMPIMTLAMNAATLGVLYLGSQMVMEGTFLLGDLQAVLNYVFQVLMSVMMVALTLLNLTRAQACSKRIKEVLDTQPSIKTENKLRKISAHNNLVPQNADFSDINLKKGLLKKQ